MKRILIAGIGNIFLGDDAFGVEVANELARRSLPPQARVFDFGNRSYDLAFALLDDYDAVILVDASQQGQSPGTLYLIEPDLAQLEQLESSFLDAHTMNPMRVLQLIKSLGERPTKLYLLGCEPANWDSNESRLGLSEPVRAAVPKAIEMIESLLGELLALETEKKAA